MRFQLNPLAPNGVTIEPEQRQVKLVQQSGHSHGAVLSGKDGKVQSIVAGTNITVDNTDPANPKVSSTGSGTLTGPASSTVGDIATFSDTTGKVLTNTTVLPIANGGTGSSTQNFVDLSSTAQTKLGSLTIGSSAAQQSITLVGITSGATLQILHDQFNARYNASSGAHVFNQTVIPTNNNTLNNGSSSNYWSNLYATTLNLNSTASLSGGTAGVVAITGHLTLEGVTTTGGTGSGNLVFSSSPHLTTATLNNPTIGDGTNITFGTTTGTQIGTASTQKLAHFGATPVAQPSAAGTATGYAAGTTAATFHSDDTYTGNTGTTAYTINGVVAALKALGLLAT